MPKLVFRILIFLAIVSFTLELVLRFGFGFCSTPLYISDPDFEYIYAPNQEVKRFGNIIRTNEYSMRSRAVSKKDTTVILLVGDSVVLGGSLTSNDSLASTLLEHRLSEALNRDVRVLNIAAGSWGPDNVAAYLNKFGLFNADLICLIASSHDAHDTMTHADQVGVDLNLPDKQFDWALQELWVRYLYPRYFKDIAFPSVDFAPLMGADGGIHKNGIGFNPGFKQIKTIADSAKIPLLVVLHPEISEIEAGQYNYEGQEIIQFAKKDSVLLVKELFEWKPTLDLYRQYDAVHYNDSGQKYLARNLYPLFLDYLTPKP